MGNSNKVIFGSKIESHLKHGVVSKPEYLPDEITTRGTVCSILKQHAKVLEHDKDRLSTDFIKSLMSGDIKCDRKQRSDILPDDVRNKRRKESHDKYYAGNKDKILAQQKEYRGTDAWKYSHSNTMHRRRMEINATPEEYHITQEQWVHIIKSQDNKCAMCGKTFTDIIKPTMDHIMPLSKGGKHSSTNIQALCGSCNSKKGDKMDKSKIQIWI
jgi:5-methylcytosine-specific restriction endonuclease McrA